MLVHVQHLLSILLDGNKDGSYEWDKEGSPPWFRERPEFQFGHVACENNEAEEIAHENERGMALERRISASEWNFAETQEKKFDERHCAGGEDGGVQKRDAEAPHDDRRDEANWHERGERKSKKDFASDGASLQRVGINPDCEDPIGAKVGGDFKREANSENNTEAQYKRDRQEIFGWITQRGWAVAMNGRSDGLRDDHQAHGDKRRCNLQMRFAAQQRSCNEVETGALGRVAKNGAIEEVDGKKMELRAWEWTDLGSFRDANEGAAKTERVRQNSDNKRDS